MGDRRAELGWCRAHGYEAVGVDRDKFDIDRDPRRAQRDARQASRPAKDALRGNVPASKGKSAAPGDIHAQSADYYENNVGRLLSIEANVDGARFTGTAPTPTSARP